MSDIADLQKRALQIRKKYKQHNQLNKHETWDGKAYAMGLVGDIGDLIKLIMAHENLRNIEDASEKIKHELADCLWSLFVIADHYQVDLQEAFHKTMDELEQRLAGAQT